MNDDGTNKQRQFNELMSADACLQTADPSGGEWCRSAQVPETSNFVRAFLTIRARREATHLFGDQRRPQIRLGLDRRFEQRTLAPRRPK